MPDPSFGHHARLSFAPAGTAIASFTEACEFVSESIHKEQAILETAGLRGTRSHPVERTRDGTSVIRGEIRLHATPALLDLLLPRILGTPKAADNFALAESLPEFDLLLDRVARRFLYQGCRVDKGVFRGKAGGLLEVTLEIVGKSELVSQLPFPAIAPPIDLPYVFHDGAMTLLGVPRQFVDFELTIDNRLAVRFANSPSATDISPIDRIVTFACTLPFTSAETDLYGHGALGVGGATLSFTNGPSHLAFTLPMLQFPDQTPVVAGRGEILLALRGTARKSGGIAEVAVVSG